MACSAARSADAARSRTSTGWIERTGDPGASTRPPAATGLSHHGSLPTYSGFSKATIWKIESGQRPVKVSELVALADSLGGLRLASMSLTREPGAAGHRARMQRANHLAHGAYGALKAAAAAYIEAQLEVAVAARMADDAGVTVTELDTSWLSVPAEEAVIEARVAGDQAEDQRQQVHAEVDKVLEALRTAGYKPTLRIEDVEFGGGGPLATWTPAQPDDT